MKEAVMRRYRALDANDYPITSVLATSEEEARVKITQQLQLNPSRVPYYQHWIEHGEKIEEIK